MFLKINLSINSLCSCSVYCYYCTVCLDTSAVILLELWKTDRLINVWAITDEWEMGGICRDWKISHSHLTGFF